MTEKGLDTDLQGEPGILDGEDHPDQVVASTKSYVARTGRKDPETASELYFKLKAEERNQYDY